MKIIELNTFAWWSSCCSCGNCRLTSLCSPPGVSLSHHSLIPSDHFLQHWNRHPTFKNTSSAVSTWNGMRLVLFNVCGGYCSSFYACVFVQLKSFHNELLTELEKKVELDARYLNVRLLFFFFFFFSYAADSKCGVKGATAACLLEEGVKWPPFILGLRQKKDWWEI